MKIILSVLLVLLLNGCASWSAHREAQEQKYLKQPLETMYPEYGVPIGVAPLNSGGKFVQFQSFPRGYLCTATVETDKDGIVVKIVKLGGQNGCIMP